MKTTPHRKKFRRESGSQLLELALVLPLLLVMAAGVMDFAKAWNTRQILANAAREGARLGATQPMLDLTNTTPASIESICQDVASYLSQANISTTFMNGTSASPTSGCSSPSTIANTSSTASNPVPLAWTYYSTGTYGLKIERTVLVAFTSNGSTSYAPSTRITLSYPYNWSFGFNHLLNLMNPGAGNGYNGPVPITVVSTMSNN
jgi:Flp pilus assembly protein TadG